MASQTAPLLDIARGFASLPRDKQRAFLTALEQRGIPFARLPIPPRDDAGAVHALSGAQRQIWRATRIDPESPAYIMPGRFLLAGRLNIAALEDALETIMDRHAVLRTCYIEDDDGEVRAHTVPATRLIQPIIDLTDLSPDAINGETERRAVEWSGLPFDLTAAPPIRACLLRMGEDRHMLLLAVHHIAADGGSIPILMAELEEGYRAALQGRAPDLPPLPVQYTDVGAWRSAWLDAGEADRQLDYWRTRLADAPPPLSLHTTVADAAAPGDAGGERSLRLPAELGDALRALAAERGQTLFPVMLASFFLLCSRLCNQPDIVIGIPADNRRGAEAERLIGCFVNTLAIRHRLSGRLTFAALVDDIAATVASALDHRDIGWDQVEDSLRVGRNGAPLFSMMFDHVPEQRLGAINLPDLVMTPVEQPISAAKFDLALATADHADGTITARIAYRAAVHDAASIDRLLDRWCLILRQVASRPNESLDRIDIRTADEAEALPVWGRGFEYGEPAPMPVPVTLARLAGEKPDAPAVIMGDAVMTRGMLDRRANALARRLRNMGAGPETRVGVSIERSFDLIVALLAVMQSGAAFVPLDPKDPSARRSAIAQKAGLAMLVAREGLDGIPLLLPDAGADSDGVEETPGDVPHPSSLAYIIHTSGSTGEPKGVMVEHGPLAAHCRATGLLYNMGEDSRELHFISFTFDGAHERWMTALTHGGAIILRDEELWSPEKTLATIAGQGATHAGFPPRYLQQLTSWAEDQGIEPPAVQLYSFGGEAMPRAGLESLFRVLRPGHAINGYGPTETVVTPMVWKGDGTHLPDSPMVPIGRPVGDRLAHILDGDLNPVPPGVAGELWIGGGGLARGYAGAPGQTADRFLPDPFGAPGARMYRTGDLARWRADGEVEFIGRRDHQVKVRGFRIELGEVEAHLAALSGVRDAAAVTDERDGTVRLVGYVAPHAGRTLDPVRLVAELECILPPHMVPARLIVLHMLPVTRNGKIDRAALPAPDWSSGSTGVEPRTPAEAALLDIWRATLGVNAIGVTDNFFEIGGDSILALQIVARARTAGYRITPKQLLEGHTVEALARVSQPVEEQPRKAERLPDGPLPLTPIQSWFFTLPLANRNRWNQSILLKGRGPVTLATVHDAMAMIGQTHAGFRLRFLTAADSQWRQEYAPAADIVCDECAADTPADVTRLCDEAQDGLDIVHGPLMRARLIALPDGSQRLFLVAHHLVVDGVSWRIVLDDLRGMLTGLCQRVVPEPATTSFGRWASLQAQATDRFADQRTFWRTMLDAPTIPTDHGGIIAIRGDADTRSLTIGAATTQSLLTQAPAAYRTRIDILLLAALGRTVTRIWPLPAITVHLEGHGREDSLFPDVDLSRTTGWFTSVYPVRVAARHDHWADAVRDVKETLAAVPDGGIGYGVLRHLVPASEELPPENGPPSLSFNYLGQFDNVIAGDWRPAPEDCGIGMEGNAPLGAAISIDGQVQDGRLVLHARYSRRQFDAATIARLMEDYETTLHSLVEHCLSVAPGQANPSDFPLAGLNQQGIDALPLPAPDILDILPPSPLQKSMLCHSAAEPSSTAYRVQVWASIRGMDPDRMSATWTALCARHDILRASIGWRDAGDPLLVIARGVRDPVVRLDYRRSDAGEAWIALRDADYARGFMLNDGSPLSRLTLLRMGEDEWRFLWTWHHALLDGWSMSRVLGELLRIHDGETLPPAGGGPRQLARWRNQEDDAPHETFWRERLASLSRPCLLHGAERVSDNPSADAVDHVIPAGQVQALRTVAARHKVTLNTLVQAALAQVIADRTGNDRIAFGVTGSGRTVDLPGVEDIIDLMVGTLPLVCDAAPALETDAGKGEWLRGILANNIAMRQHEHAPPTAVQSWTDAPAAPFDTLMVFENYPVDEALWHEVRGDLSFSDVGNRGGTSYPLTVIVVPRDTLSVHIEYRRAFFGREEAEAILAALVERLLAIGEE